MSGSSMLYRPFRLKNTMYQARGCSSDIENNCKSPIFGQETACQRDRCRGVIVRESRYNSIHTLIIERKGGKSRRMADERRETMEKKLDRKERGKGA
ncbi:hypothetical protein PoB_003587400 [Plakobranchus ocellatus]|uniref:Uncharacterized protein n=1 Tax=Plakobranchus ocellatus TaxID=259542 RepID=A0AAV4ASR0_9GAST|nr:hypothetical protein PoB_003587400 [Plakobranchus ocellatus]